MKLLLGPHRYRRRVQSVNQSPRLLGAPGTEAFASECRLLLTVYGRIFVCTVRRLFLSSVESIHCRCINGIERLS